MPAEPTTIEGAITQLLIADAAVNAIAAGRVHPFDHPQSVARPKLTVWRWGTDRDSDAGGFSNDGPTGFAVAKVFVDAWADDRLTAKQLANAARRALCTNVSFPCTVGEITLCCIHTADEREQPGQTIPGRAAPVQRQTLDLRVSYQET